MTWSGSRLIKEVYYERGENPRDLHNLRSGMGWCGVGGFRSRGCLIGVKFAGNTVLEERVIAHDTRG